MKNPPIYGLTGNMGCGKSTVAEFFGKFKDVVVFNADQIAKELLCEEQYSQKLQQLLGPHVFSEGKIDIGKVAQLVFNDYKALQKLESFIHPLTWNSICERMKKHTKISFFLVETALIYETEWQRFFKAVIVVMCDKAQQYHRLHIYRGLSDREIDRRLKRQLANEEKMKRADFVIDTTCSLEEVENKACRLYHHLKGGVKNEEDRCLPRHF